MYFSKAIWVSLIFVFHLVFGTPKSNGLLLSLHYAGTFCRSPILRHSHLGAGAPQNVNVQHESEREVYPKKRSTGGRWSRLKLATLDLQMTTTRKFRKIRATQPSNRNEEGACHVDKCSICFGFFAIRHICLLNLRRSLVWRQEKLSSIAC